MIENILRRNFVRFLVQKAIFCPISGNVLDVDTCYVINDVDGDPSYVVAPHVGEAMERAMAQGETVLREGYTLSKG